MSLVRNQENILDDARSDLRAATGDADAKPGMGQQFVGVLFVLAIFVGIVYAILLLGHSYAVWTVRAYDSELATRTRRFRTATWQTAAALRPEP